MERPFRKNDTGCTNKQRSVSPPAEVPWLVSPPVEVPWLQFLRPRRRRGYSFPAGGGAVVTVSPPAEVPWLHFLRRWRCRGHSFSASGGAVVTVSPPAEVPSAGQAENDPIRGLRVRVWHALASWRPRVR